MKIKSWKETAELIGIFSILASLIFVALQLRQEQVLMLTEMRAAIVANSVAVNDSITDNAEIWVRGNAGEDLSVAESEIYSRLVENVTNHYFQLWNTFVKIEPGWEGHILTDFAGFLFDNPGAYEAWINREQRLNAHRLAANPTERVGTDWIDAVESKLAILKQADAP